MLRRSITSKLIFPLLVLAACGDTGSAPRPDGGTPDAAVPIRPIGVALCYSDFSSSHPATLAFWAALQAGNHDARADVIVGLTEAVDAHGDEEEFQLLLGLAHLWRLAEPLAGEEELSIVVPSANAVRDHLRLAYSLCPTDHRIAAWLGPVLVRFGRMLGDQTMIDEGIDILDQGIAAYPSFVLFSKLLIYAELPKDDPDFQQALDAVVANASACASAPGDPACTNHPHAAHNIEGAGLFLGDAYAKGGLTEEARTVYLATQNGQEFTSWQFQSEITSRIAELDSRAALFANSDPDDAPPVAWTATNQCVVCHQGL